MKIDYSVGTCASDSASMVEHGIRDIWLMVVKNGLQQRNGALVDSKITVG
jgi:hypothetical protein